jgi:hypothetical protein
VKQNISPNPKSGESFFLLFLHVASHFVVVSLLIRLFSCGLALELVLSSDKQMFDVTRFADLLVKCAKRCCCVVKHTSSLWSGMRITITIIMPDSMMFD